MWWAAAALFQEDRENEEGLSAMAEGRGPTHLLDVCNQKFSEFLFSAEYKYLVWLREIEEEALKRFESNFNAEPELMPKTPSQRKNRKKKRSSSFHYENKELTRKRMRSGIKTACFQMLSQSKEGLENFDVEITDSISYCITRCAKEASEVQSDISPEGRVIVTNCGLSAEVKEEGNDGVNRALCSDGSLVHVAGTAMMLPSEKTEKEDDAFRLRNTPSPKAAFNEKSSNRVEEIPAQGLVNNLVSAGELFQELKENTGTPASSQSGHRHPNRVHKNKKVSLAERYSLSNKRKSMVRKSLSRAMAKKKAAQDSSSVCSQVNSHSSLEVFMDDETSDHGKQSYKCSVDDLPSVQNMQDENNSSHKTTSYHANKIIRPFKNFFQSIQKNQLLKPSGSPVNNSVKHSTPTRPPTKGDFVEKQRQRLESLRKKQEAEQQRKQKVEEEKRRRLEEIKLKREERLRKALQARERVEQMEEEKKKRLGQKLSQQEEKSEKVREEKAAEEKNRKKKSIKKTGEAETRKQKMLQVEEEPKLQEQQEKWKTVGEIRKMLEHNKAKQEKGHCGQKGKERLAKPLDLAIVKEEKENLKKEQDPPTVDHQEKEARHMEAVPAGCKWLNITAQKPEVNSSNEVNSPKVKDTASRKMNPNDYGMDLNSDDSTDDENEPRKPIPAWAIGLQLTEAVTDQYYNPRNINRLFGVILDPKLEDIFYKSKPRYFKRTSSAVWQSPPATKPALHASNSMIKF
ncbi:inner centromere protein isoform X2 [Anolis carolinensis]|uniref:inner centromere protein isoform X2 n=1 Tax=Anolis carolinensis TaxID=28377 RepID=UPI002F2B8F6E